MKKATTLIITYTAHQTSAHIYDYKGKCLSEGHHLTRTDDKVTEMSDPLEIIYTIRSVVTKALKNAKKKVSLTEVGLCVEASPYIIWDHHTHTPVAPIHPNLPTHKARHGFKKSKIDLTIKEVSGQIVHPNIPIAQLKTQIPPLLKSTSTTAPKSWKVGGVDSWIMYHLTQQETFKTSVTHAITSGLYNIQSATWDKFLTKECGLTPSHLPSIHPCLTEFGHTKGFFPLADGLPIMAITTPLTASHEAIRIHASQSGLITLESATEVVIEYPQLPLHPLTSLTTLSLQASPQFSQYITIPLPAPLPEWMSVSPATSQTNSPTSQHSLELTIIPLHSTDTAYTKTSPKLAMIGVTPQTTQATLQTAYFTCIAYECALTLLTRFHSLPLKEFALTGAYGHSKIILQTLSDLLQIPVKHYHHPHIASYGLTRLLRSITQAPIPTPKLGETVLPQLDPISRYASITKWQTLQQHLSYP